MLSYLVLALLSHGADHGYRIKKRLDRELLPTWRINDGQIYQTLARLRRARWIEELPPDAHSTRGNSPWPVSITPRGRRALRHWLSTPVGSERAPAPPRSAILGQILLGEGKNFRTVLASLDAEQATYELELQRIKGMRSRIRAGARSNALAQKLATEATLGKIQTHIDWLETVRAALTETKP